MQALTGFQSDTTKLIVLYLRQVGDATPQELANRLDLRLLTVLVILQHLEDEGLIKRLDSSERAVYSDPDGNENWPR